MQPTFKVEFNSGETAWAAYVTDETEIRQVLREFGLENPYPVIVVVGGASGMSQSDLERLANLMVNSLAKVAEELGAAVVDGGTDAGVMRLIGQARARIRGTFPLLGVAARGTVELESLKPVSEDKAQLEPNHSKFFLVPGTKWGDESGWIAKVAGELTGSRQKSVTLLINGGEIAWQDVSQSLESGRPVLVLAGTGRTADIIAAVNRGEKVEDERAKQVIASPLLEVVDLNQSFSNLMEIVRRKLE